jgi:hypothetical protein
MSPRIINYESSIGSKMVEAKRLTMNARNRYHYTAKLHPLNYLQVLTLWYLCIDFAVDEISCEAVRFGRGTHYGDLATALVLR